MNCIILNSGKGTRISEMTAHSCKCMIELTKGETIYSRQIDLLSKQGIEKFYVTTGYLSDSLKRYSNSLYKDLDIEFIENPLYETTNYIVSLHHLKDRYFDTDLLLLHGDLVFTEEIVKMVVSSKRSSVVVDSTLPLNTKDFKAGIQDDHVTGIGVDVFGEDCVMMQPFYYLEKKDWLLWQNAIENFCHEGQVNVYAENALNTLIHPANQKIQLSCLDAKGMLCSEIDTKEDLDFILENISL